MTSKIGKTKKQDQVVDRINQVNQKINQEGCNMTSKIGKTKKQDQVVDRINQVNQKINQEGCNMTSKTGETNKQDQVVDRIDFNVTIGDLEAKIKDLPAYKKLHLLRSFAKFRGYFLNRYEVVYSCDNFNLVVRYVFDKRGYNFLVDSNGDKKLIINTRDVDENLACILYEATKWVVHYLESGADYNVYYEARKSGYLVRVGKKII
jgi:hypothetical protein